PPGVLERGYLLVEITAGILFGKYLQHPSTQGRICWCRTLTQPPQELAAGLFRCGHHRRQHHGHQTVIPVISWIHQHGDQFLIETATVTGAEGFKEAAVMTP